MPDVIVIGAGIGGLACAAKLAKEGKRVLVLEKIHHIGGTSHIFKRKGFTFPMGPLSFSYPTVVSDFLKELGLSADISFKRAHFQLIFPLFDIIYSQEWVEFKKQLLSKFPDETTGIQKVFNELNKIINILHDVYKWHPNYTIGNNHTIALEDLAFHREELDLIEHFDKISAKDFLYDHLFSDSVIRLLGSQGTYKPIMSMLHLAFMWNVMSFEGIWFPSCGIHGINEFLYKIIISCGGEVKLNIPIEEIIIENGVAKGVRCKNQDLFSAKSIVSNADYKTTFLNLIKPVNVPNNYLELIRKTRYTGSELCIYLGIDPNKVDLKNMRADHLFFRREIKEDTEQDSEDFSNKEIEICLWSNKSPNFCPEGKKSVVLRVNMPYKYFDNYRLAEKKRKDGYTDLKKRLAKKVIEIVEDILPGLSNSIEVMEIATPLTYRDWGQRYEGSVAGWTRDVENIEINSKLLIETPIKNLLMVGIYSVIEPFLGGYPVSLLTGKLAADLILEKKD